LIPPAALICSTASFAPSEADLPSDAAKPVKGALKPILKVSAAWPLPSQAEAAKITAIPINASFSSWLTSF